MNSGGNAGRQRRAERWRAMSRADVASAELLLQSQDYRGSANRAYYSAYHAATAACVLHGDEGLFPHGWNNPAHDQLPELIRNNGDLSQPTRSRVIKELRALRAAREIADYKPEVTADRALALDCVHRALTVLNLLGVDDGTNRGGTD